MVAVLSRSSEPLTSYAISRIAGIDRAAAVKALRLLLSMGWVVEDGLFTPSRYRLNPGSREAGALAEMLERIGYTSSLLSS